MQTLVMYVVLHTVTRQDMKEFLDLNIRMRVYCSIYVNV